MTGSPNQLDIDKSSGEVPSASTSLLSGLRARDNATWRRMAALYTPLIFRWCLQAGVKAQVAEDVVQEVFRVVASRIEEFSRARPDGTFRGWLWTITRNKLGDCFRALNSQPQAVGGSDAWTRWAQLAASDESSTADGDLRGLSHLCRRALSIVRQEFEETTWQAFWRVVVEEERAQEVADSLGVSVNAVYLAKSRVLRRLRVVLGDQDE